MRYYFTKYQILIGDVRVHNVRMGGIFQFYDESYVDKALRKTNKHMCCVKLHGLCCVLVIHEFRAKILIHCAHR